MTATGSGVVIKDSGVLVGVAQSINFDRNIDVTALFGGNATVSAAAVSYTHLRAHETN